jgi:hypothetical protein
MLLIDATLYHLYLISHVVVSWLQLPAAQVGAAVLSLLSPTAVQLYTCGTTATAADASPTAVQLWYSSYSC